MYEKRLPVNSTVILLRPEADGPELTGLYEVKLPDGTPFLHYRYRVIRLWEIAPEVFLHAGIAVLPLAVLGKLNKGDLPVFIQEVRVRVEQQLSSAKWADYWTGVVILMGLKFDSSVIQESLKGISTMIDWKDSSIVKMFLEQGHEAGVAIGIERGAIQEARKTLLGLVLRRFGAVDFELRQLIESTSDLALLEKIIYRAIDAQSIEELFDSECD